MVSGETDAAALRWWRTTHMSAGMCSCPHMSLFHGAGGGRYA